MVFYTIGISKRISLASRSSSFGLLLLLLLAVTCWGAPPAVKEQNTSLAGSGARPPHQSAANPSEARAYQKLVDDARKLIFSMKWQEAKLLLDRAIKIDPQDYRAYEWRSWACEQVGHCSEALADAEQAVIRDPRHMAGLKTKLVCLVRTERYEEAIRLASVLAKKYPLAAWIYLERGKSLCATGKYAQAIPDFSKAIEGYPNSFTALALRALASAGMGDCAAALRDIELISKLTRQSLRLSTALIEKLPGDAVLYKAVARNFDRDIQLKGRTAKNLFARALCYFVMEKYPQSIQDCTEAIKSNGAPVQLWILRAYDQSSLKQTKAARADVEKAITLAPQADSSYAALADLNFFNSSYAQSVVELSDKLKASPRNIAILVARGRVFAELNKQQEAISDFSQALELNAKRADVLTARAEIYESKRRWDAAISDFSKAIALEPQCPTEAYKGRAACYAEQHSYEKAIEDLNKLITCTRSARPFFARSICYEKLGQRQRALADKHTAETLEAMDPFSSPAHFLR